MSTNETSNLVKAVEDGTTTDDEAQPVVAVAGKRGVWGSRWGVMASLTLNLSNSTLGAGVLGLPYVASQAGVVLAVAMLVGCAVLTDWTLHLLLRCHELTGLPTYEAIGERCFGRPGSVAVAVGILLINCGAMIAYLVIVGDLVAPLISVPNIRYAVVILSAVIAFPLCLVRGRLLALVSAASVILVVFFVVLVVAQAAEGPVAAAADKPVELAVWSTQVVFVFGIVVFAYSCHTNMVPLAAENKQGNPPPDTSRQELALHAACALCALLYVVVASCGYAHLRSLTPSNYLFFFPKQDVAIAVFRCVLAASLLFTLPLCVMPNVAALADLTRRPHPVIYSGLLLALATLVALFVPQVSVVFSLTGSVASSLTSFILPPVFYARLNNYSFRSLRALPYVVCAVFGTLMAVLGVVSTSLDIAGIKLGE
jgi:amino acid permease